jgi:membrane-associated HD superfamily phosphohydrolase
LNDKTAENTKLLEANTKANEEASKSFKKQIDLQISGIENVRQREIATLEEKQRRDKQALEKEYINASNFKQLMLALEVSQKRELNDLQDKFAKEDEEKSKEAQRTILEKKADQYKKDFQLLVDAQKLKTDEQNKIAENITIENEKQNKEDAEKLKRDRALAAQQVQVKQEQYASEQADLLADKDAKVKIAQLEVQQKLALYDSLSSGLSAFSSLAGKETAAGKALAIASATISTYTAIAKQLAAFAGVPIPGYAIVQAIATGVAGFAAVKNIIDTPVPNGGGSSGGGGGSLSFVAPPIPQIPQSVSGTRLNQTDPLRTINEGRDSKVFVTETDITKTQNKVKNIIKKATIK